jgi:hypothetical protein
MRWPESGFVPTPNPMPSSWPGHVPIVYHYAERKIIWFPPSSDAQLLMEGINRHKVEFAIVVHRKESYYLPPDDACFAPLLLAYPDTFRLIYQTLDFRIFRVSGQ